MGQQKKEWMVVRIKCDTILSTRKKTNGIYKKNKDFKYIFLMNLFPDRKSQATRGGHPHAQVSGPRSQELLHYLIGLAQETKRVFFIWK